MNAEITDLGFMRETLTGVRPSDIKGGHTTMTTGRINSILEFWRKFHASMKTSSPIGDRQSADFSKRKCRNVITLSCKNFGTNCSLDSLTIYIIKRNVREVQHIYCHI